MTGPTYIDPTRYSRAPYAAAPSDAQPVTPSDTVDLPGGPCRALYVGGTGDLKVTTVGGSTGGSVVKANQAGTRLELRCTRVWATGTTATNIVALY